MVFSAPATQSDDASTPVLQISLRQRRIAWGEAVLSSRSQRLIHFVAYLAWRFCVNGKPEWVSVDTLAAITHFDHPRQFQRYMDTLQTAGMEAVVEYQTKTCGPWRLGTNVKQVAFDLSGTELDVLFPSLDAPSDSAIDDEWLFAIVNQLSIADACFHNGYLADSRRYAESLLDSWNNITTDIATQVLLQLHIARSCVRATQFDAAASALAAADNILQNNPEKTRIDLQIKVKLAWAKLHFDQGQFLRATAILQQLPIRDCHDSHTLAHYHNLAGLAAHRSLRMDTDAGKSLTDEEVKARINESLNHYRFSVVSYLLIGDYNGVQAVCFNIGNLLACDGLRQLPLKPPCPPEQVIRWFILSETICNKQSVGGDSIWALLMALKTALNHEMPLSHLQEISAGLFAGFTDYLAAGQWICEEARRIGNQLEIAESLELLARIEAVYGNPRDATAHAKQALSNADAIGRKDIAGEIKKLMQTPNFYGTGGGKK